MANHAPLRWGLLGTAHINRAVIAPLRSSKKSQLVAVASRSQEKASAYAAQWSIPRFFPSYEAMLSDPEIDIVYISLPNSLHAEWSIKAMQMGKHVLCEKPLTASLPELDAVIKIARATGMVITEAFMYRHHPQTLLVKQMVEDGQIGSLQLVRGSFCYTNTRPNDVRFDPSLGGGCLWDVGCYPIGYSCFVTGTMPTEVYGYQVTSPSGVDVLYAGQLQFPGGVISQFECSFITEYKVEMVITGDKGRLTIPEPYKPDKSTRISLQLNRQEKIINIKGQELYQGEITDMENAVLDGTPPRISLAESREIVRIIEALYQSSHLSQPVTIEKLA
jgi:D-xylose 1-dehydrogenase (NADP+, D-xylono-1,5-lactone-forming)